jgi:hypothetical protein
MENLARFIIRTPFSQERMTYLHEESKVIYQSKDAQERMESILSTYNTVLLQPNQEQAFEDILRDARLFYRKKGLILDKEWALY